jgi:DNA-binding transcriptional regulator LsrR (DeoR family)
LDGEALAIPGGVPGSQASQLLDNLTANDRFVAELIEKAIAKKITQKKVAEVLGLSLRQIQRMVRQSRRRGA